MTDPAAAAPGTRDVARVLAEIGTLLELNGKESFRARAFLNAARALEGLDVDLLALARENRLQTLRGVGTGIAAVIRELVLTGRSTIHDELSAATPPGLYDLLRIPGLGPRRIHALHTALGIENLESLEAAANAGRISTLPGFGEATERRILEGIAFARSTRQRRRYPEALEIAARLVDWLRAQPEVSQAEIAGAVRRRMEVVDGIDLVAASSDPAATLERYRSLDAAAALSTEDADEAALCLSDSVVARLRCVPPEGFVAAMLWETGSSAHLEALSAVATRAGGSIDRDGLVLGGERTAVSREAEVYERLGLAYIPPELREGLDEVERAASGESIRLVEPGDLRGTFHCHSTYSDGRTSLVELAAAARERGWTYLGIADHSRSAAYARGLTIERVRAQQAEVDGLNREFARQGSDFRLLRGIESDILPDGALDYPDDVLFGFDFVVGSVHSSFGMSGEEMTRRVIRAMRHPALTILGHPTGRLLLTREGYDIDVSAILATAAETGTIIEINSNPHRLDLDWRHVREGAELGVLFAVNPDAHSVAALDHVAYGVNMARKAGLPPERVVNTWPLEDVTDHFAESKRKQAGKA